MNIDVYINSSHTGYRPSISIGIYKIACCPVGLTYILYSSVCDVNNILFSILAFGFPKASMSQLHEITFAI